MFVCSLSHLSGITVLVTVLLGGASFSCFHVFIDHMFYMMFVHIVSIV